MKSKVDLLIRPACWLGAVFAAASVQAAVQTAPVAALDSKVGTYLEQHCYDCHDSTTQKGDFRVDNLSPKVGVENTPQWLEIMERISSGEMPPKKVKTRPSAEESAMVVEWLSARMKEGESARMALRPPVSYNRLTRDEYVNTVRDLLGVEFNATDPGAFLEDPEWHGFERIGSVLTLSPSNVEKYLAAAETILAEAYPEIVPLKKGAKPPEPFGGSKPAILADQVNERHRERLQEMGVLEKLPYEIWPGDIFRYSLLKDPLPETGVYEISYTVSGLKPEKGLAPRIKVYESKLDRTLYEQDIVAPEDKPVTVTFRAHLAKGRPNIEVYNDVPGPSNLPRSGRHGNRPFVSLKDGRMPWQIKLTDEQGRPRYPFLILHSIAWRGPIITDHEKQLREDYQPKTEGDLAEVREGFRKLATRAFRRPVRDEELDGFVGIVEAEMKAGEKFPSAVKAGMAAILCSKSFIFIAEGDPGAMRHTLNDWEIASRLSYLLWSTMPDAELFALAEAGKLRDKAELSKQVARMLADPRSERFTDAFASQWLRLRKVGMFPPDKMLYPDYDKHLEACMTGETRAFFREVLISGLTLREFLDSDWTMANARLAQFYGLPADGLPGDDFQRVALKPESQRGGLLTQAAILSLTSDGTRHRPVHRGVWVMESIFGKSPPPPPANVEPIATNSAGPKATLRQKLEAHIHDASCAACHAKIDPLGLAFENFDAIGRWRTTEKTEGVGDDPSVNPSGKFPDGRTYKDAEEFKKLLLADLDHFNRTFTEKLTTYALRRATSFDDLEDLKKITAAGKAADYRVKDILTALVTSDLFQKR
jgi:mono/diheme cytochrome c family protein